MEKLKAVEYLEEHELPFKLKQFSTNTEKGAANVATALGFRERQMIKTLIFETDAGEKSLVMVGGDQNIKSGLLKKVLGSRNFKLAAPDTVISTTGYAIGSIPPFHWQPPGFRSFLEATLLAEMELGVGTGCWGCEIIITPQNLIKASNAQLANLVETE